MSLCENCPCYDICENIEIPDWYCDPSSAIEVSEMMKEELSELRGII